MRHALPFHPLARQCSRKRALAVDFSIHQIRLPPTATFCPNLPVPADASIARQLWRRTTGGELLAASRAFALSLDTVGARHSRRHLAHPMAPRPAHELLHDQRLLGMPRPTPTLPQPYCGQLVEYLIRILLTDDKILGIMGTDAPPTALRYRCDHERAQTCGSTTKRQKQSP
jgi:hypothetical protein